MWKKVFKNRDVRNRCHIYRMLQSQGKHLSFHTPGHKQNGWDITELSYADNLSSPTGCIAKAQKDIAEILGAERSFILTDGSTSGVFSMLHAFVLAGCTSLAIPTFSHKSVKNGCTLCGITPIFYTAEELQTPQTILQKADGLLIVSPDYYGHIPDLQAIQKACQDVGKPLLCDGAHGGHLHADKTRHAGSVADMWVDGVHKSLPAFTQGAVVSAKTETWAKRLQESVDIFRTTSPSYPIMASVEYAVKYPANPRLEERVRARAKHSERWLVQDDWTKLVIRVGKAAFVWQADLEKQGIYAEFCDGENVMFYLSPASTLRQWNTLCKAIEKTLKKYSYEEVERSPAPVFLDGNGETELVDLACAVGRVCQKDCGLFPPCTTLIAKGEKITKEKIRVLQAAEHTFGLTDGKITVLKADTEE